MPILSIQRRVVIYNHTNIYAYIQTHIYTYTRGNTQNKQKHKTVTYTKLCDIHKAL